MRSGHTNDSRLGDRAAGTVPLWPCAWKLPDGIARRIEAEAHARGLRPEQVVLEAVKDHLGPAATGASDAWAPVREELRDLIFDGSLREEIDAVLDDPDLQVT